jgi:ubiquitin carboxyl-terminal hydrolase 22/27/51
MCRYTANIKDKLLLGNPLFDLFALTVHSGTINQGHYVAYVNRYGTWYNFNDEYFNIVSEKEALSQEAYLMFYK